jgi:carbon dioxide concentrating mechanism protein CcmO
MYQAMGGIEVYGMPSFIEGADAMLKASVVRPVRMGSAGIALMYLWVSGDVGAVRAAVDAGVAAAGQTSKVMAFVLPNPSIPVTGPAARGQVGEEEEEWKVLQSQLALGAVQTDGLLPLVEAADVMCKTANVLVFGYQWIGLRCHTMFLLGEIGDVRAAVDSGVATAKRTSSEVFASLLANPDPTLVAILGLSDLAAQPSVGPRPPSAQFSMGIMEAKGLCASAEGCNAMLKAARVQPVEFRRAGLTWITTFIIGELGAVRSAIEAGQASAQRVGDTLSCIIPSPTIDVLNLLGINGKESGTEKRSARQKEQKE